MMVRIILFSVFLLSNLSCVGQKSSVFSETVFNLKNDKVTYNSNLELIKNKISIRKNLYKSLIERDSLDIVYTLKGLNHSFNTNSFSKIIKINQLEFSLGSILEDKKVFVGEFTIQEWVFLKEEEAIKAYGYLLKVHSKENEKNFRIPLNWDWLLKDNVIYFISSESYYRSSKEFNEVLDVVKKTVFE